MAMKILAVGDLHLGRRPSRLPNEIAGRESSRALGPSGAWRRLIDAALEAEVDVVVLAGDVVERENDFFEAYRDLREGVERLAEAGIGVYGVAGNHDVQVLPRLADQIEAFHLLGRGGVWEKAGLEVGGERVTLWGWSFAAEQVMRSPLEGVRFERGTGVNIGLLHCDRDQSASPYAPVASRELEAAGLDAWLLGHIHRPDALSVGRLNGYLGSVSGNDPGEAGARGPWLVTIDGGRIRGVEQWALAPLRWERIEVDIGAVDEVERVRDLTLEALRELDESLAAGLWSAEAVGVRLFFTGRSRLGEQAIALFSDSDRERTFIGRRQTHYFIEHIENRTRPEIALEELARRNDPPGLLAARLLLLDQPEEDPARKQLLSEARQKFASRAGEPQWRGLQLEAPDIEETAEWLRRAGMVALEGLLAQREEEVS